MIDWRMVWTLVVAWFLIRLIGFVLAFASAVLLLSVGRLTLS